MPANFSCPVTFDGQTLLVVIVPSLKRNGMHYEINVPGFPRFLMGWSPLGRYDVINGSELKLPGNLVLAVSDILESDRSM
jgi:hypothetical protein